MIFVRKTGIKRVYVDNNHTSSLKQTTIKGLINYAKLCRQAHPDKQITITF